MSIDTAGAIPELNTLTNRLRVAREFAGLTQSELAERAGIGRATVSGAERGIKTPGKPTVTLWAFACGVDVHWLRTGEAKTPPSDDDGVLARHEGFEPPTF